MMRRFLPPLVIAGSLFVVGEAEAAVFVLNNAKLTTSVASSGFPVGVYQVSGEIKVNTADGSDYAATAWNITISGPVSTSFVKGISGIPDDGSNVNEASPGDESAITICRFGCGTNSISMTFGSSFNSVYKDPTVGSPGSYPTSTGALTLTSISLRDQGDSSPATGNVTIGQADFVPLVPSSLVLLPIAGLFGALSRRIRVHENPLESVA